MMNKHAKRVAKEIGEILEVDQWARQYASSLIH
jgi:hypothetical protein